METMLGFFQGFINLGAAVMLPVVIAILGLFFRMKIGQAIRSGLLVGIGFQGLVLVITLLMSTIKPVMEYYEKLGTGYDAVEIGFAALGAASWTVPFAVFAIPAIVLVNILLVRMRMVKVLNVDVWNFMHFLVPGALTYALFGSAIAGFLVTVGLSVITLFFAEWQAKKWGSFFGLEGTACTCLSFVAWAYPISVVINKIIDFIPGVNKLDVDMDKASERLGVFGEPAVIGLAVGAFLSLLTSQPFDMLCKISIGIAGVMVLLPRMVSIMMEGLSVLGAAADKFVKKSIGDDAELYIGVDIALGLGDPACIVTTAIVIPVTIAMALIIPDMRFFPLGLLAEICYLSPLCVLAANGNVLRTVLSMSFIMFLTLFLANMFVPEATKMMSVTGVAFDGLVTASHFGWNPGNVVVSFVHMIMGS